jgi:ubiquinone/menaquinone biosynthesis C-methylase UbiE
VLLSPSKKERENANIVLLVLCEKHCKLYLFLQYKCSFLVFLCPLIKFAVFSFSYDVYSFSVIPAVGELVAGDRQSYQYLVESIRRFPKQVTV